MATFNWDFNKQKSMSPQTVKPLEVPKVAYPPHGVIDDTAPEELCIKLWDIGCWQTVNCAPNDCFVISSRVIPRFKPESFTGDTPKTRSNRECLRRLIKPGYEIRYQVILSNLICYTGKAENLWNYISQFFQP